MESTVKSFKEIAKEAKSRFKNGFWKELNEKKSETIKNSAGLEITEDAIVKSFMLKAKEQINTQYNKKTPDDFLYERVCELLSSDDVILDPIKRLIDEEYYCKLSSCDKQTYVLSISSKFTEMKRRFYAAKNESLSG